MWIAIEGDNGAGKDTLAERFEHDGWDIVTNRHEVAQSLKYAASLEAAERVESFVDYNRLCGELASSGGRPCLLIRYWPSTVAAAYADGMWDESRARLEAERLRSGLPLPHRFLYLECALEERRSRVIMRGGHGEPEHKMSSHRDSRYKEAIGLIRDMLPPHLWAAIDVTQLRPDQVYQVAMACLRGSET